MSTLHDEAVIVHSETEVQSNNSTSSAPPPTAIAEEFSEHVPRRLSDSAVLTLEAITNEIRAFTRTVDDEVSSMNSSSIDTANNTVIPAGGHTAVNIAANVVNAEAYQQTSQSNATHLRAVAIGCFNATLGCLLYFCCLPLLRKWGL